MRNMAQPLDRAAVGRSLLSEAAANALDLDYQKQQQQQREGVHGGGGGMLRPEAMDLG